MQQAITLPHLHQRLLDTHGQVWVSLLYGHCLFLLGPGAHNVLFVPSQSLFPQSCVSSAVAAAVKSHLSCPTLCDTIVCSHQAPPSLEFSRQEYWSGLPCKFKDELMVTSSKRAYVIPRSTAQRAPASATVHCWPISPHPSTVLLQSLWGLCVLVHMLCLSSLSIPWLVLGLFINVILPLLLSFWGFSFVFGRWKSPQNCSSTT